LAPEELQLHQAIIFALGMLISMSNIETHPQFSSIDYQPGKWLNENHPLKTKK
jgi:hypothetical protein